MAKVPSKNGWILLVLLLTGLIIGGLIAELSQGVPWLSWLSYGKSLGFGDPNPLVIDLIIVRFTVGLSLQLDVASILGMLLAAVVYRLAFWK